MSVDRSGLAIRAARRMVSVGAGLTSGRRRLNFPLDRFSVIRLPVVRFARSDIMKTTQTPPARPSGRGSPTQTWADWQRDVVAILRRDFREALEQVSLEDIDWLAWLRFYIEGRSPSAAVDRALERDL